LPNKTISTVASISPFEIGLTEHLINRYYNRNKIAQGDFSRATHGNPGHPRKIKGEFR